MKHKASMLTLAPFFLIWLILVLGCASSGTNNKPETTPSVDRLAPLTDTQKADILVVMKMTEDLDSISKNRRKNKNAWALYVAKYTPTHEKFEQVYSSLPKNDARMMLYNMMEAYENVGSLLLGKFEGKTKESPDDMILVAGIRKALLKRIVEGNLTPEMIKLLEDVRQQDK